jgi:TRAP-type C4-dicarboxylate transport system permease small subunit
MKTFRNGLNRVLEFVCCTLLALMTLFATWQVVSRYVFNKPSTVTEELVLMAFVWMGLLGAAYVFGRQEHMRMSFLVDKLSPVNQIKIKLLSEAVVMIFAIAILIFGGFNMSRLCMGQVSSSLQIPMGYVYLALPLSGIVTVIYNILNIADIVEELTAYPKSVTTKTTQENKKEASKAA